MVLRETKGVTKKTNEENNTMGKLNDLKEQAYGGFLEWLEEQKVGDIFSNDVWASKIFDRLFQLFQQSKQSVDMKNNLINAMEDGELKAILADRERARTEAIDKLKDIKKK